LARDQGVPTTVIAENGSLVRIAPGAPQITESSTVGRLSREGNRLVRLDGELVRGRTRAIYNGAALVTVTVGDEPPLLKHLQLSSIGLMEQGEEGAIEQVRVSVREALGSLAARDWAADATLAEAVRLATRRTFRQLFDKRPVVAVHVVRQENHSRRDP
jgi:ribonuclease J